MTGKEPAKVQSKALLVALLAYHLCVGSIAFRMSFEFRSSIEGLDEQFVFRMVATAVFIESIYRSSRLLRRLSGILEKSTKTD